MTVWELEFVPSPHKRDTAGTKLPQLRYWGALQGGDPHTLASSEAISCWLVVEARKLLI